MHMEKAANRTNAHSFLAVLGNYSATACIIQYVLLKTILLATVRKWRANRKKNDKQVLATQFSPRPGSYRWFSHWPQDEGVTISPSHPACTGSSSLGLYKVAVSPAESAEFRESYASHRQKRRKGDVSKKTTYSVQKRTFLTMGQK